MSDEQLIGLVRSSDAAALEALYNRYASTVMGLGLKITADSALAEEVVQETFWRVWNRATDFQAGRGTFPGWMLTIARNLAIDTWRKRKGSSGQGLAGDLEDRTEHIPDPAAATDEVAWASIAHARVRKAVDNLPEPQRRVLELAYFRGMTRQEIAELTGEPLGTIHTRARLGLEKLREELKAEGFEG